MTPYWWTHDSVVTDEMLALIAKYKLHSSLWFPPGYMRDDDCWMYNHKKPSDPPQAWYNPHRGIQEIDADKLFAAADLRIRLSGFEGPTHLFDGYLCPNYEDYTCMTHPGPQQNLTMDESFDNHVWLVELMKGRYPACKLANWGLPQYPGPWGQPDLGGYQMLGQLTWMYDYGAPSAYQLHRDNDIEHTQARMNWAARWDMPLIVYVSPWERWRTVHGGDNKWYAQTPEKMQQVFDIVLSTPNVVGVEMWSMVRYHYIQNGWMEDGISHDYQIDAQHASALRFLGQALG